ncbi:MAG: CBS domain-containing protein [Nitrososphaeria archaeon]|nr:CBS domain-containing protein [Nitrosopumilaceae archaeon]NIP09187.1 CBS domain-containing protein [Nitrosopumilaceae archaeon]NIP91716.1 CBS domain-containing protein [Nitrososphaeria archaeon]NIS95555.1 CBS domain-containing protein [Nitrosopumilaceae archaeon]
MSINEISNKPITILKDSTLSDVIRKLLETKLSRLIVLESGNPVGIITEKDVGLFLLSETSKQGLDDISISKIMKPVLYVDEGITPKESAKLMIEKGVSSLTLGSADNIQGIFTKTDLVKYFLKNSSEKKVVDYMTHNFVFTHSAAPLFKVVKKMLENKVSRIIVKNQNEEAVGVISFRDLFRISLELGSEEDDTGFTISDQIRKGFLSEEGFGDISLAREVMSKGIISIKFNEKLTSACQLILENNVSGLVVLDGNGDIAGIISKTDVVRALID